MTNEPLLTVQEVCERLKVKRSWVRNRVHKKQLPVALYAGRYPLFLWSQVVESLQNSRSVKLGIANKFTETVMRHCVVPGDSGDSGDQVDMNEWIMNGGKWDTK